MAASLSLGLIVILGLTLMGLDLDAGARFLVRYIAPLVTMAREDATQGGHAHVRE
jgi:hypothetical protein